MAGMNERMFEVLTERLLQAVSCVTSCSLFFCIGKTPITLRARIGRGFLAYVPPHPYLVDIVHLVYHVMA